MNLKFEGYGLYVYQVACRPQVFLCLVSDLTTGCAIFMVLLLTVLCFLLLSGFFMRS